MKLIALQIDCICGSFSGTCLTNDIDTLLYHMNNSRYFRELDFARADFFERTGLYRKVLSKGGEILQGAATIRYRRYIRIFSRYKITTKVSGWIGGCGWHKRRD